MWLCSVRRVDGLWSRDSAQKNTGPLVVATVLTLPVGFEDPWPDCEPPWLGLEDMGLEVCVVG